MPEEFGFESSLGHMGGKQGSIDQTSSGSQIASRKSLRTMIERQDYCCALTGWKLTPNAAVCDHIIPVSKGGELKAVRNIQIIHETINRMKGTMTQDEFVAACQAVAERHLKRK